MSLDVIFDTENLVVNTTMISAKSGDPICRITREYFQAAPRSEILIVEDALNMLAQKLNPANQVEV